MALQPLHVSFVVLRRMQPVTIVVAFESRPLQQLYSAETDVDSMATLHVWVTTPPDHGVAYTCRRRRMSNGETKGDVSTERRD